MLWRSETLHLPLSSSRRRMRNFSAVVEVSALAMLDTRQDLPLGGGIAPQLIGDDHPRDVLPATQQFAEKTLGSFGVAPALHEDIEHGAVLIHGTPEIMLFTAYAVNTSSRNHLSPGRGRR